MVTKWRTGLTCDTTCTHGAMLSIGVNRPLISR